MRRRDCSMQDWPPACPRRAAICRRRRRRHSVSNLVRRNRPGARPACSSTSPHSSVLEAAHPLHARAKAKDSNQRRLEGKPDGDALYEGVQTHEGEHVADLKKLMNSELKPYHDFLLKLMGKGESEG